MANELQVDAAGLRSASASSYTISGTLTGGVSNAASSSQPSSAGIAAVNAALASVRGRHANRITGQSDALSTSSARYDTTDSDGSDAIAVVSV
ncbi:hypothetical protein [Mycolicibacterium brisbanense]